MEKTPRQESRLLFSGVWFYNQEPTELIESGELLTRDDFYLASHGIGQSKSQATYAFNYLVFTLEIYNSDDGWYSWDTFYDLKDPHRGRSNSYYIECQAAAEVLSAAESGEAGILGYGPKTLELLRSVLYDTDSAEELSDI